MKNIVIQKLPEFDTVTVIINVKTHLISTLALLSAKKQTNFPIILVECSNDENEYNYFNNLKNYYDFYLIKMPLQIHGKTLDILFKDIKAKYILLLDSDSEIIDGSFLNNELLDDYQTFGIGFIHNASPMSENSMKGWRFLFYQERMYIPCVLLNREKINQAISNGCSFEAKKVYNDLFSIPIISKLFYYRFYFKFFQKYDIPIIKYFRKKYYDYFRPSMIYYDTGAEIYMYLKYKLGYNFLGIPNKFHEKYFYHYHGVTRKVLNKNDINTNCFSDSDIIERLKSVYNFNYP